MLSQHSGGVKEVSDFLDWIRDVPYVFRTRHGGAAVGRGGEMGIGTGMVIVPEQGSVGFQPKAAKLKAAVEKLVLMVDWSKNSGYWKKVTVENFEKIDDPSFNVAASPLRLEFLDSDGKVQSAEFLVPNLGPEDTYYSFDVVLERPGETLTIDPVIIIKPWY